MLMKTLTRPHQRVHGEVGKVEVGIPREVKDLLAIIIDVILLLLSLVD